MKATNKYKVQYLKKTILSKWYNIERAEAISGKILHWREMQETATTQMAREFCDKMIAMYLQRYSFYVTGGFKKVEPLSIEETRRIKALLKDGYTESTWDTSAV